MIEPEDREAALSLPRIARLAKQLDKPKYRHSYLARQLRTFLATQIRALRGDMSQAEFGRLIGKPQNVVSRLENEEDLVSLQTLIDIALKLDIALIVRFTDWPTFLKVTNDFSPAALRPARYDPVVIAALAAREGN